MPILPSVMAIDRQVSLSIVAAVSIDGSVSHTFVYAVVCCGATLKYIKADQMYGSISSQMAIDRLWFQSIDDGNGY